MFKKRALQVKVVKASADKNETGTTTSHLHVAPEDIERYVKLGVVATVAIYSAKVFVDTASKIAVELLAK